MTIRQLYELNKNNKSLMDNNSENMECENKLYIEFLIEDSSTGRFPFCDMYEIRQNKIFASGTDNERSELWDFNVKSYFIETDYQDFSLIRIRVKL